MPIVNLSGPIDVGLSFIPNGLADFASKLPAASNVTEAPDSSLVVNS